jgi:hypothetical protein
MVGLELVAGYLVAWGVRRLKPIGKRLDEEADEVIDMELDRLHDAIATKLGADPALAKLEAEISQGTRPDDLTLRQVQDAVAVAAKDDFGFGALIEAVLKRLAESGDGIDLRGAKGVQVGNFNQQTNSFH